MAKGPLVCNLDSARKGCGVVADHILNLVKASQWILSEYSRKPENKGTLRSAYILNLTAYEETGKLFLIWQALADAERKGLPDIRIDSFEYHVPKGEIAGDLCCQMLDFVESRLTSMSLSDAKEEDNVLDSLAKALVDLAIWASKTSVSAHRERVYRIRRHFEREREDAMYADFRNEKWVDPPQLSHEMLLMDCMLLNLVVNVAQAYLAENAPFSTATKALMDMQNGKESDETRTFLSIIERRLPGLAGATSLLSLNN